MQTLKSDSQSDTSQLSMSFSLFYTEMGSYCFHPMGFDTILLKLNIPLCFLCCITTDIKQFLKKADSQDKFTLVLSKIS